VIRHLCAAVLVLMPTTAFAQGNPGPFGGLFGRSPDRVGKDYRVFDIRTVATGQFEDALNDSSIAEEQRVPSRGIATGGVSGNFEQRSTGLQIHAMSRANHLQYLQQPYAGGLSVDSSGGVSLEVATRLTLDAAASYLYTPHFQFHPQFFSWTGAGALIPPSSPYVATAVEGHSYGGVAGFVTPYAKHSTFRASVERREMRFSDRPDVDMSMHGMRAEWTRQLHDTTNLKLGYGRERGHFGSGNSRLIETINAGFEFVRPMSPGRRTSFGIRTETAKLWTPDAGRRWRLNGGLDVTRWLRRTWLVRADLQRTSEFVAGFVEPLLADTVGVSVSGMPSRRTELVLQVNGGRGQVGFEAGPDRFTMGVATAQMSYALSRRIGLFVQHAFFYYELPQSASPIAPVTFLNRQTMTVGITTWIPVYTRERSPSDSR
jgi:hypothetical protein